MVLSTRTGTGVEAEVNGSVVFKAETVWFRAASKLNEISLTYNIEKKKKKISKIGN